MDILTGIAKDLRIAQSPLETEASYRDRVILSAVSKWMLTSVYKGGQKTSIVSLKRTCQQKLMLLWKSMQSDLIFRMQDADTVVEYIYNTLLENGAFYHIPQYVIPCEYQEVAFGRTAIIRGMPQDEMPSFSGLAPFKEGNYTNPSLDTQFDLPEEELSAVCKSLWERSAPVPGSTSIQEYLRFNDLRRGYYTTKRLDQNNMTMGRNRFGDNGREYFLIKGPAIRRVPDTYVQEGIHEYYRLSVINGAQKQVVKAKISSSLIGLEFGFKLPEKDLRFLRFIAWPSSIANMDGAFSFSMHPSIWQNYRARLEHLSYKVEIS